MYVYKLYEKKHIELTESFYITKVESGFFSVCLIILDNALSPAGYIDRACPNFSVP